MSEAFAIQRCKHGLTMGKPCRACSAESLEINRNARRVASAEKAVVRAAIAVYREDRAHSGDWCMVGHRFDRAVTRLLAARSRAKKANAR